MKHLSQAKSRLASALAPADRAAIVLAMLRDTLSAALQTSFVRTVTVVTPDEDVSAAAKAAGALVLPEMPGRAGNFGLNAALSAGAASVRRAHGPAALLALQADLPALRSHELDEMLASAPAGRGIVADHHGDGTAALVCRDPHAALAPRFGHGSASAHRESGAVEMAGQWPGLRLDVDTAADLDAAIELGAGAVTIATLRRLSWPASQFRANIASQSAMK